MSLYLVPEAAATVAPMIVVRPASPRPDTRPVESSDKANAGGTDQQQRFSERTAVSTAPIEMSVRPPGTDPSVPPQSVFDGSLISENYKPTLHFAEEANETDITAGGVNRSVTANAEGPKPEAVPSAPASAEVSVLPDAPKFAAYALIQRNSPLSSPAIANPDWLSAVDQFA